MARQIIILNQPGLPSDLRYRVCFWLSVPQSRWPYYANPEFTTQFLGASAAEITALQQGQVWEQVEDVPFQKGTGMAAIATALEKRYAELQDFITNQNPWNRYGSYYDGTSWTQVTVA